MQLDLIETMLSAETPEAKAYLNYFQNSKYSKILKLGYIPNARMKNEYIQSYIFEIDGIKNQAYTLEPKVIIYQIKFDFAGKAHKGYPMELSVDFFANEILSGNMSMWKLVK